MTENYFFRRWHGKMVNVSGYQENTILTWKEKRMNIYKKQVWMGEWSDGSNMPFSFGSKFRLFLNIEYNQIFNV